MRNRNICNMIYTSQITDIDLPELPLSFCPTPAHMVSTGDPCIDLITYPLSCSREIRLGNPHPSLTESKQTCFRTNRLDVCTTEVILRCHELLQIYIRTQTHARRVKLEDVPLRLHVGKWELDLAVNTTWSKQSSIKNIWQIMSRHTRHL